MKDQPDFHPPSWWDRLRFRYWLWRATRLRDVGQRVAAFEALWSAWVSRWPGTLPPSARLVAWFEHRFDL